MSFLFTNSSMPSATLDAVDPDHADLKLVGNARGQLLVCRPDRATQPVGAAVGQFHGLGLVLDPVDRGGRAEQLLADLPHLRRDWLATVSGPTPCSPAGPTAG